MCKMINVCRTGENDFIKCVVLIVCEKLLHLIFLLLIFFPKYLYLMFMIVYLR